ncbi:MAG: amidase [Rhodospirillales bacterium]|nr:amidase [Rhodospirillales bacterium]
MSTDRFGALCSHTHAALHGAEAGRLAGLTFVAKDVFDIAGHCTGAGNPDWLRTHPPAEKTATVVERLLRAGANMVGKSHTDELAYSLNGQNHHYGTPVNPHAPERIPGGSSSGSAVAVAGGLVDFSIGTDCGGSVRLPASYCGVLGFRPTHGRIPLDQAVPLAPSLDVVGWFACDAGVLEAVGEVLLEEEPANELPSRLYVATDLFGLVPDAVREALQPGVEALGKAIGTMEDKALLPCTRIDRVEVFRTIQGSEAWAAHGEWIRATEPAFGPGVRERFEMASSVSAAQLAQAQEQREAFAADLYDILTAGVVACLPTAPGAAPLRTSSLLELENFRRQALGLLSVAGLARLPQISLPLGSIEGCPVGLSVISQPGADSMLLALAKRLLQ